MFNSIYHKILLIHLIIIISILSAIQAKTQNNKIEIISDPELLQSILNITTDTLSGTSFLYNRNNNQYLITAKHLFKKHTKSNDLIFYTLNNNLIKEPFNSIVYFHPNQNVDIAVLKLTKPIRDTKIILTEGRVFLGQDIFFFGFPLNLALGTSYNGVKLPLIKKAIFSGVLELDNIKILLLDGFNIEGFSGGPILSLDNATNNYFLLGIINGYYNSNRNHNSGIIFCNYSEQINEIIDSISK